MRYVVGLLAFVALAATAAVAAGFEVNGGEPIRIGVVRLECPAPDPAAATAEQQPLDVEPVAEVVTCR